MQIHIIKSKFLNGSFDQNTYVLVQGNQVVIIDAGADIEDIKQIVGTKKVLAVLFTHLHFDHTWNIEKYVSEFDCDIYIKRGNDDILTSSDKNASEIIGQNITHKIPKSNIKYYAEKLKLGSFDFDIIFTPGHSEDSVCLLVQGNLFCGDTLFYEGVGRTDLYGGSSEKLKESLLVIKNLKFNEAFSGHFEPFSKAHADREINYYI